MCKALYQPYIEKEDLEIGKANTVVLAEERIEPILLKKRNRGLFFTLLVHNTRAQIFAESSFSAENTAG